MLIYNKYFLIIKSIKYSFQIYNHIIYCINKDCLLPEIYVNFLFLDSIVNLYLFKLNLQVDLTCAFNHLQYYFYSLNKEEIREFKKFIEY